MKKDNTAARVKAKLLVQDHAAQKAREDIAFATAGNRTLGFTPPQLEHIRFALEQYARTGAATAFDSLSNHAKLCDELSLA